MKKINLLRLTLLPICLAIIFGAIKASENYHPRSLEHSTLLQQDSNKIIEKKIEQEIKQEIDTASLNETDSSYNNKKSLLLKRDSIRQELIKETKEYILKTVPKAKSNVEMVVEPMVEHALGNNIELSFMLAQAQIETAFGTAGIGRANSKKSMFGVMKRTYETYEDCILHYIVNLKKNYLVNGRTIHHLMKNYVTVSGYRYAGDRSYESKVKRLYLHIKSKTKIDSLEDEYRKIEKLLS
ncbi:MAG: glucosaminidase domain-containing protein [Erysipelotrichales bacterium]|nr:glucosaminidase domain-containing protein [Erysipelotrichales bacterium]